jgi:hypothetical protein
MKLKSVGSGSLPGASPGAAEDVALDARSSGAVDPVTFVYIQRDSGSHVVTVNAAEIDVLFHDGMLMPVDSVNTSGKQ